MLCNLTYTKRSRHNKIKSKLHGFDTDQITDLEEQGRENPDSVEAGMVVWKERPDPKRVWLFLLWRERNSRGRKRLCFLIFVFSLPMLGDILSMFEGGRK